ncbi:MAG: DUF4838 domain-containing protein [Lentisphaeria bacterium]|nr:DUF4838 domain-containing protein [Lentisphaeria bacterium]
MIYKIICSMLAMAALSVSAIEIKIPAKPSVHEKNTAALLQKYAEKIDKNSKTVFRIAYDGEMQSTAWSVSTDGKTVTLKGGRYGIYLAVAHYLQDICDVMFYSPFERDYLKKELPSNFKAISGKSAFELNEIHSIYGRDNGDFAIFRGIVNDGYEPVAKRRGFGRIFGRPYNIHTFMYYIPAAKYFKQHPDWFAEVGGKRENSKVAQLCLSNTEMRKEVLSNLRKYIVRDIADAKKNYVDVPWIYDISQNDNQRFCRCKNCNALAAKYGNTQSGLLLDFINEIAREIRKEYPNIMISTAMYQYTEKVPSNIKPENNVLIVLTDTLSNVLHPHSSDQNRYFRNLLQQWAKIAPNIRVWDYNITYTKPQEMPYNSEWTYQSDMKFFRDCGVKQLFTEFEEAILADVRDYKIYLKTAVQENPDVDFEAVRKKFVYNFYGKAGDLFLQYRDVLKKAQERKNPYLGMYPPTAASSHLDLQTVTEAQKIFEKGIELLKDDPVRLKRWRFARLGIDRATLIMSRPLMAEYLKQNGSLKGYPFADRKAIAERVMSTVTEQAKIRLWPSQIEKLLKYVKQEVEKCTLPITERSLHTPEQFKNIPADKLFDFTMENSMRWRNYIKLVNDPESDVGTVASITFPSSDKRVKFEDYKLPIWFCVYSPAIKKNLWGQSLFPRFVKKSGYNWYKLGETKLSSDCVFVIFRSWNLQLGASGPFDMNDPDRKFEVWVRIKFTGPGYPFGKKDEPDAFFIERVMLVKK